MQRVTVSFEATVDTVENAQKVISRFTKYASKRGFKVTTLSQNAVDGLAGAEINKEPSQPV